MIDQETTLEIFQPLSSPEQQLVRNLRAETSRENQIAINYGYARLIADFIDSQRDKHKDDRHLNLILTHPKFDTTKDFIITFFEEAVKLDVASNSPNSNYLTARQVVTTIEHYGLSATQSSDTYPKPSQNHLSAIRNMKKSKIRSMSFDEIERKTFEPMMSHEISPEHILAGYLGQINGIEGKVLIIFNRYLTGLKLTNHEVYEQLVKNQQALYENLLQAVGEDKIPNIKNFKGMLVTNLTEWLANNKKDLE